MKLQSVKLWSIGHFTKAEWTFAPHFSIGFGGNEAGKTTLLHALFLALYGGKEQKALALEDLRSYLEPQGGSRIQIIFEEEKGDRIRLDRRFAGRASQDEILLFDETLGKALPLKRGEQPGEFLLGLDAAAFCRSLFVGPAGALLPGGAPLKSLRDRLKNIPASGQEDVSLEGVKNQLEKEVRRLQSKTGRGGLVPALEVEAMSLEANWRRAALAEEKMQQQAQGLEESLLQWAGKKASLKKEQEKARVAEAQAARSFAEKLDFLVDRSHALMEEEARLQNAMADQIKKGQAQPPLEEDIDRLRSRLAEKEAQWAENSKTDRLGLLPLLLTGGVLALLGLPAIFPGYSVFFKLGAAFLGVLTLLALWGGRRRQLMRAASSQTGREEIELLRLRLLEREKGLQWQENRPQALAPDRAGLEEMSQKLTVLHQERDRIRAKNQALQEERMKAEERFLKAQKEKEKEEETLLEEYLLLGKQKASLQAALFGQERSESLHQQLRDLKERLQEEKKNYEAATLALEAMGRLDHLQAKAWQPQLEKRASEVLTAISAGKYSHLYSNEDFVPTLEETEEEGLKFRALLSKGTEEEAYFSLRIALLDQLDPKGTLPLLLDDPFLAYDDQRLGNVLDFLQQDPQCAKRQILLMTCHQRVCQWAEHASVPIFYLS